MGILKYFSLLKELEKQNSDLIDELKDDLDRIYKLQNALDKTCKVLSDNFGDTIEDWEHWALEDNQ